MVGRAEAGWTALGFDLVLCSFMLDLANKLLLLFNRTILLFIRFHELQRLMMKRILHPLDLVLQAHDRFTDLLGLNYLTGDLQIIHISRWNGQLRILDLLVVQRQKLLEKRMVLVYHLSAEATALTLLV